MGNKRNGKEAKVRRQQNASNENAAISAPEQLERLDARLGKGVGAVKERARLAKVS